MEGTQPAFVVPPYGFELPNDWLRSHKDFVWFAENYAFLRQIMFEELPYELDPASTLRGYRAVVGEHVVDGVFTRIRMGRLRVWPWREGSASSSWIFRRIRASCVRVWEQLLGSVRRSPIICMVSCREARIISSWGTSSLDWMRLPVQFCSYTSG
jgi:hypothetical protein